jgi:hypothetical protein
MPVSSALGGAALVPSGFGFRNLLINGAMQIAQRGTSTTGITGTGYFSADRWNVAITSLGTWTQSIENDAPTGSGFSKSLKMLCTTADASPAADDRFALIQKLEGQNVQEIAKGTTSAKQLSLSFWVKSNVTGTYIASIYDNDNNRFFSSPYTVVTSGAWEKKTISIPADTTGAFDNDANSSLEIYFSLGAGSNRTSGTLQTTWTSFTAANFYPGQVNVAAATNNYWQITGVQLEANPVATDFEHRPIGVELALCQRYYYREFVNATGRGLGTSAFTVTSTSLFAKGNFPVELRTAPTALEQSGTANHFAYALPSIVSTAASSAPTFWTASKNTWTVNVGISGATANIPYEFRTDNTNGASAYLAWSAEL